MTSAPKVYSYRWVILLVFMLINMVVQIQWLAHAAVARPAAVFYEGQFDPASFINIDFLAMIYMVTFLVMSFPASYVIDTYGIRVGISLGAVLVGVCGLLKGLFADDFTAVVVAQLGLAVAQPFILNAVTAVSVRWFPLRERGMAAGFSALAQYLGIVIAMIVTPFMVGSDPSEPGYGAGFEQMLLTYGWLTFGVAVVTLLVLRERPPTPPSVETIEKHSFGKGIRHILKQRDMLITLYLFFVGLGIFNAVDLPRHLHRRHGAGHLWADVCRLPLFGRVDRLHDQPRLLVRSRLLHHERRPARLSVRRRSQPPGSGGDLPGHVALGRSAHGHDLRRRHELREQPLSPGLHGRLRRPFVGLGGSCSTAEGISHDHHRARPVGRLLDE
ncbi:MAG: MFS transporter [Deltaproteobacteria bacterium]|nr:MFS transporter [Deltaproteobacteria bacterium]